MTEQEVQNLQEQQEDAAEDTLDLQKELMEDYDSPEPDLKCNQHVFLSKAAFDSEDTTRTTFLTEEELGRPLFSVRFMLDLHKMAFHDGLFILSDYFLQKVQNVTHTGMSREGFAMNLNVTQKKDMIKKRGTVDNLRNQKEMRAT